jgi:hypothetical protein
MRRDRLTAAPELPHAHPIGFFHVDIAEVRTAQGKLYLFVAIDRASKLAELLVNSSLAHVVALAA